MAQLSHSLSIFYLKTYQVAPALVSVNEKEELAAQKQFYDKLRLEMGMKRRQKLDFLKKVSLVYNPIIALIFVGIYWFAGLKHAEII